MYVVSELTRQAAISNYYAPVHSFVVSYRFYYGASNEGIATFWSATFSVTEPLTDKTVITGVVYENNINYSTKDSLADCLLDDQSYYWDQGDQILYIHYNHLHRIDTNALNFDYGISIGLTDDKLRYFENRPFYPFLIDFPRIEVSVDKFNYDQLSFIVDTITMDNRTGFFNQFKDTPIYGNKVLIKTGEDGDEYADLTERAVYFVDDYNFSAIDFLLNIQDIRKTATAQIPNKILNLTDYPNLGDNFIGKTIPFAYTPSSGFTRDVPGLLVNEAVLNGTIKPDFIFLEVLVGSALTDIKVYIKDSDDVWVEQTSGVTVNWSTGVVTVDGAETLSGSTYSAFPVKADVRGVDNTYASDIIIDMNSRFLGFEYDSSNYDTTQWEKEESYLTPISLFMDSTKDVYEWMRDIQSLSTVGFRYTNTASNKRLIKIDNPNRDLSATVQAVQVKNPEQVIAESNREDVYNKIYIGYNKSVLFDTADRIENIEYFVESFAVYKIESVYNKTSGLLTSTKATKRAALQAEDYFAIHKVFEIELIGSQFLDLQIYDIIQANISLQSKVITWTESGIETATFGDEYFGWVRGQIISTRPNYTLQTNTIRLREKAYSDIWPTIHNPLSSVESVSSASGALSILEKLTIEGSSDSISNVSGDATVSPPMEADLIAFSTDSADVSNWNKVDGVDVTLDLIGKYPKAHASEGTIGGGLTHTHDAYSGSSASNLTNNRTFQAEKDGITLYSGKQHSHTINHTHDAENHEPEYLKVLPVTDGDLIKTSMFLFYDGASAPTGWSELAAAVDKMYKGDATPETTPTGGLSSHSHAYTGSTGATTPATYSATNAYEAAQSSNYLTILNSNHSHTMNHTHTGGENYPEWIGLIPVTPDSETLNIPSGICAFFKGSSIPTGWSAFNTATGKFIQGKSTNGGSGGANTHSHGTLSVNSGYYNDDRNSQSGTQSAQANNTSGHYHSVSHEHSDAQDNQPPYQELMFLKKD